MVAEIVPSTLQVDVENGSGVAGVAHKLAAQLQKQGFKIGSIGDAPSDVLQPRFTNIPRRHLLQRACALHYRPLRKRADY